MARTGGSAQDRRRARRAAARRAEARQATIATLGNTAVVDEPFEEAIGVLINEKLDTLFARKLLEAGLYDGAGVITKADLLAKAGLDEDPVDNGNDLSALERFDEALAANLGQCGNCEHQAMSHFGDDNSGACAMDGCDCSAFEPMSSESSAEEETDDEPDGRHAVPVVGIDFSDAALEAAVVALAPEPSPMQNFVRLRLTNLVFAPDGDIPVPAATTDLPPVTPGPPAPVDEQPTRASRTGLRWTADFVPEGVLTDDGRAMAPGSLTWRELPLSLMAMLETQEGHDGARVSGRIDRVWREGNMIRGEGMFDDGDFGLDVARLVDDRTLRGVSVDIAVSEYETGPRSQWFDEEGNWRETPLAADESEADLVDILFGPQEDTIYVVTKGVIGAVTVCPFPAFADASISLAASLLAAASPAIWTATQQHRMGVVGCAPCAERAALIAGAFPGTAENPESVDLDVVPVVLTAAAAGLAPLAPPAAWFDDPELDALTPLTIDDEGRVFGHAAAWDTCHIAFPNACTTAPHSKTDYSYFHLKEIACEDGSRLTCGTVTIDASHAGQSLDRSAATAHYDHTGTAAIDVRVGEDEHGIWFAGALRPEVDAELSRRLRGSVLSGDWRRVDGNLELVALLCVNVPGFPVPRPRALVAMGSAGDDEVLALVAAGIPEVAIELPSVPEETRTAFHAEMQALRDRAAGEFAALAERAHAAA